MCAAVALGCGPTARVPSPKSNWYKEMGEVSASVEPEASAVTVSGAGPVDGTTEILATGAESGVGEGVGVGGVGVGAGVGVGLGVECAGREPAACSGCNLGALGEITGAGLPEGDGAPANGLTGTNGRGTMGLSASG